MPLSLCFLFQCLVVVRGFISPIIHRCLCPVPQYKKPLRDVHLLLLLLLRMELMGLHALFLDKGLGAGLSLVWFGSGFWFFLFYFYINRWWIWSLSSTLLLNLIIIIIIIVLNPLDRMCLFFWKVYEGHGFSWTPLCMRWEDFSGWLLFIIMIAAICDVATAQIIEKSRI